MNLLCLADSSEKCVGKVDVRKQVVIGCVDFSKYEDFYDSIELTSNPDNIQYNKFADKNCIFDFETKTVWIFWYKEDLV